MASILAQVLHYKRYKHTYSEEERKAIKLALREKLNNSYDSFLDAIDKLNR